MGVKKKSVVPKTKKALSLRVLVVENHPDMRQGLKTFLAMLEFHACIVEDLASARQAAEKESFDVLLTDISLPDGDGWDLVGQLRDANCLPLTTIAMSGFGSPSDVLRSERAGFMNHLIKPFMPDELEGLLLAAQARTNLQTPAVAV